MRNLRLIENERGIALLFVIQLGFAISLLLTAWLLEIQGRNHFLSQRRDRLTAYYTAEAGLNKAIWILKRNPNWRTENMKEDPLQLEKLFTTGSGDCRLSVEDYGNGASITATGYAGKNSKTMHALMGFRKNGSIYFVYSKPMNRVKDE